jgi:hypothetical protein
MKRDIGHDWSPLAVDQLKGRFIVLTDKLSRINNLSVRSSSVPFVPSSILAYHPPADRIQPSAVAIDQLQAGDSLALRRIRDKARLGDLLLHSGGRQAG